MSSYARDMVEGYDDIAKNIEEFLENEDLSKTDLIEKLESVKDWCRENYNVGSYSLGWRDSIG
ncbi:hypothetical protein CHOTACABRAS_136 [Bacillus phage Chotacabras]|nr:hypothetical protein CHOTACABRAS_136 [Bacillus phage Chotacabras]